MTTDQILARWKAGDLTKDIAAAAGLLPVSVRTLVGRARAKGDARAVRRPGGYGVARPFARAPQALALLEQGLDHTAIAARMGVKRATVAPMLNKARARRDAVPAPRRAFLP